MRKEKIREFIRQLRTEKGLTQKELAARLGVSDKAISRWERGEVTPDIDTLTKIAEYFDISDAEIIRGERNPDQNNLNEESSSSIFIAKIKKWLGIAVIAAGLVIAVRHFHWFGINMTGIKYDFIDAAPYFEKLTIGEVEFAGEEQYPLMTGRSNQRQSDIYCVMKDGWQMDSLYIYKQDKPLNITAMGMNMASYGEKMFFGNRNKAQKFESFENLPTGVYRTYYYLDISNPTLDISGTVYVIIEKFNTVKICIDGAVPGKTVFKEKHKMTYLEALYIGPEGEVATEEENYRYDTFTSLEDYYKKYYTSVDLFGGDEDSPLYYIEDGVLTIFIGKEKEGPTDIEVIDGGEGCWAQVIIG